MLRTDCILTSQGIRKLGPMKKLLFIVFLAPMMLLAQADFRGMSWGDSFERLQELNSGVSFDEEQEGDWVVYSYKDNVAGADAYVLFSFSENKLVSSGYIFDYSVFSDTKEKLRAFNRINERLEEKYDLKNDDDWLVSTWKGDDDSLDHAIDMGDVVLRRISKDERTSLMHQLGIMQGSLTHLLFYYSSQEVEKEQEYDEF